MVAVPPPTWPLRAAARLAGRGLTRLQRHPLALDVHFHHSLVLTWAVPPEAVADVLVPGLALDTHVDGSGREWAFVAAALVELEDLRPHGVPPSLGGPRMVMVGYRVFTALQLPGSGPRMTRGRTLRGLRIVASQSTGWASVLGANLTTRYHYRKVDARVGSDGEELRFAVTSDDGTADLDVTAHLGQERLPAGSVFADARTARRFAGPLPYTFSPDPEGVVVVRSRRDSWQPRAVAVDVARATFLEHGRLAGVECRLSNAFHVADVDYGWRAGELHRTRGGG